MKISPRKACGSIDLIKLMAKLEALDEFGLLEKIEWTYYYPNAEEPETATEIDFETLDGEVIEFLAMTLYARTYYDD